MREKFFEFYQYTEEEYKEIWENGLIVLDASVLLNLYRYTLDTSKKYVTILKKFSKRIWLPYQAALEYHNNRIGVIRDIEESCNQVSKSLKKTLGNMEKDFGILSNKYSRHPFLDINVNVIKEIKSKYNEIDNNLKKSLEKHPKRFKNDDILISITKLFNGLVGDPYDSNRIDEIQKDGFDRYENAIPPGYKDENKKDEGKTKLRKYGDLILWYQIIDKANETKKPIIFVTDDRKDDWWWKVKGKTIGPRHELVKEIRLKAKAKFIMYTPDKFLEHASKYLKEQIEKEAVKEIKRISYLKEEKDRINREINEYQKYTEKIDKERYERYLERHDPEVIAEQEYQKHLENLAEMDEERYEEYLERHDPEVIAEQEYQKHLENLDKMGQEKMAKKKKTSKNKK